MFHVFPIRIILPALIAVAFTLATSPAHASEVSVRFELSSRETYVGVPVTLSISIDNAKPSKSPVIPKIDGAEVQPVPGERHSSMEHLDMNTGQRVRRDTLTLTYRIVPSRTGAITIPPITVKADGENFTSDALEIAVIKSESGDLMFVDLQADKTSIYVGQALPVTLRIWVRPYRDRRLNVALDANDMFNLIDIKSSEWGDFAGELSKLRDNFGQLRVRYREELRADADGGKRSYFVYQIPTVYWPQQPGPLAMTQPRIVLTYPVRLGRNDSFFGMGSLELAESKPVVVTADVPAITVNAPPAQNQPPTFTGAVGQFNFAASVKPPEVSVGDPITLTMTVTDRTPPPGARIDLLAPPALERVPELTENFRMPSDPLAGSVQGKTKVFTQTLRAKSDQVLRIPPLPFTYFDPIAEQYVTTTTEPLAIKVNPALSMAMSAVVAAPGNGNQNMTSGPSPGADLTEVAGGILANYGDVEAMLAPQEFRLGWAGMAGLLAPPLLFMTVAVTRWRNRSRFNNAGVIRRRSSRKRAIARIHAASARDPLGHAETIRAAVCDYIADRFDLAAGTLASGDAVHVLRDHRASDEVIHEVESLLGECEQMVYAGGMNGDQAALAKRARACIDRLERERR